LRVIGIAVVDIFLRHAVERGHDQLGLKRQGFEVRIDGDRERLDIIRIVIIGRRHTQGRLRAHIAEHAKHFVAHGGGCRGRILRIERHHQQPVAALRRERIDPRADRWIAVAHRPVDHDVVMVGNGSGEFFGLRARNGFQRRFVVLGVPDFQVIARLAAGTDAQDDAVQHQLPQQPLIFDHPRIGQKFLEIDAHAPRIRAVGGAEIDQEHADPFRLHLGHSRRSLDGNNRCHDITGFARCTMLVKIMALSILSRMRA
jgi:hypothetical protein